MNESGTKREQIVNRKQTMNEIWNKAIEEAAEVARQHFVGMFTGWKGYSYDDMLTLDNAEEIANECGSICADAIRKLKK